MGGWGVCRPDYVAAGSAEIDRPGGRFVQGESIRNRPRQFRLPVM
jgi:hypothetical protein